jgi:hypothetical protein
MPSLPKRDVIAGALALAAVLAAAACSRPVPSQSGGSESKGAPAPAHPPDPEVLALLGDEISRTRRLGAIAITRITGVEAGAIRLDLQPDQGAAFRFEILKKDPAGPAGIAETNTLSIYLISQPGSQTLESQTRAAQALAERLAAEETRGAKIPALTSMREREAARR